MRFMYAVGEDKLNELKKLSKLVRKNLVLLTPYDENEEGKTSYFDEKDELKGQKELKMLYDRAYAIPRSND